MRCKSRIPSSRIFQPSLSPTKWMPNSRCQLNPTHSTPSCDPLSLTRQGKRGQSTAAMKKTKTRSKHEEEEQEDGRGDGGGGDKKEEEGTGADVVADADTRMGADPTAPAHAAAAMAMASFRRLVRAGPLLASRNFLLGGDGDAAASVGRRIGVPSSSSSSPPPLLKPKGGSLINSAPDGTRTGPSGGGGATSHKRRSSHSSSRSLDVLESWSVVRPLVTSEHVVLPQRQHERDADDNDAKRSGGFALEVLSGRTSRTVATLVPPLVTATTTRETPDQEDGEVDPNDEEEAEEKAPESEEDIGVAGHVVSAEAVSVPLPSSPSSSKASSTSSLVYVGLSTGVLCEYNLDDCDDAAGGTTATGHALPNVPPRRTFRLRYIPQTPQPTVPTSIPPKDDVAEAMEVEVEEEKSDAGLGDAAKEEQAKESESREAQEEAEPKDVGRTVKLSRRKRKLEEAAAAVAAAAAAASTTTADKATAQVNDDDDDEWAPSETMVSSKKPRPLRLHHLTFVTERSTNDDGDGGMVVVGYGLASPTDDDDEESARDAEAAYDAAKKGVAGPHRRRGRQPRHPAIMMLVRFRVPPYSTPSSSSSNVTMTTTAAVTARVVDRWDLLDGETLRGSYAPNRRAPSVLPAGARIPFQLLSTRLPASSATARPDASTNVVLVASPAGLAIYSDDDPNEDTGTVVNVNDQQVVEANSGVSSARKSGRLPVVLIHNPRRSSHLLTAVAMSASSGAVATAYWSGEIRVWPSLLSDVVQYLAEHERLRNEHAAERKGTPSKKKKKKHIGPASGIGALLTHPVKASQSIRLHWHAHPVSSVLFSPDDPSVLYSGGEESVLCVWEWKRSGSVASVLPRISTGPIVHLAAATSSSSSANEDARADGGSRRLILHTSDNVIHCILLHNLAIAWKKAGLAAEPNHSRKLLDSSAAAVSRVLTTARTSPVAGPPIMLTDRHTQSLLLTGLPRSPAAMQEWNCCGDGHLDKSWPVAPFNRVSRQDWDDEEVTGPSVTCASLAAPGTLLTVDVVPTENQSIGLNGLVTTLKFWTRRRERWELSCAMSSPHGSLNDVSAIAVAPNGAAAVSVSNTEKAWRLWRRKTSKQNKQDDEANESPSSEWMGEYRVEMPMGLRNYGVGRDAVSFSPDSSVVAMAHGIFVSLWDYASMSLLITLRHTSQDRFLTLQPSEEPPSAVHTLQFVSHLDMILTASEESVALQYPHGAEGGRLVPSDGWSHRAPSGHRIVSATEAVRNRTQKLVAVASYSVAADASVVELLDLASGQLLRTEAGGSGRILSISDYPGRHRGPMAHNNNNDGHPRRSQPPSFTGDGSVWDLVPSYTPVTLTSAHPSEAAAAAARAAAASSLPTPYRIPAEPLELLLLNSKGQLLSLVEEVDGTATDHAAAASSSRDVHDMDVPALPKIAMFEAMNAATTKQRPQSTALQVMDWTELAAAPQTRAGALDGDGAVPPSELLAAASVAVPTSRLGAAFVRAFVSRSTTTAPATTGA
jgi:WD40 repeat protein